MAAPPTRLDEITKALRRSPKRWLVTGAAGFIGSNLLEYLLRLDQHVVGMDNFATGQRRNVDEVSRALANAARFAFIEADILDEAACRAACEGIDVVLHQAALGSVPRSIANPSATNAANVTGFVNMLAAAHEARVPRFVFASSSSVYGDSPAMPKREDTIGRQLSPYAVSKYANELYAYTFQHVYGIETIGLRYFNVFGRRQDPDGPYAAVIPRWVAHLLCGEQCVINGDGETSRDFCYIDNVLQANLLAATAPSEATHQIYNIAFGERTTLNDLFAMIRDGLGEYRSDIANARARQDTFRPGDVRHSLADITKARQLLGYAPTHDVQTGLSEALEWYVRNANAFGPAVKAHGAERTPRVV